MDVFRFTKYPPQPNDPIRRYRLVHGPGREQVGAIAIGGDAPEGDTVILTVNCDASLSDAAREDALGTSQRFVMELVTGWGIQVTEVPDEMGWTEQPDGAFHIRREYRVVCASP